MADEVEITNVGGEGGVASEATLASLTRAIEKLAASTGKDPKKEAGKVQQMHTRTLLEDIKAIEKAIDAEKAKTKAVKKATEAVNRYSRALLGATIGVLGSLTGSVLNLTKAMFDGSDQLSDFAQHIPIIGSHLSVLTRLFDDTFSAFQNVATSGASFNNSLTELRNAAAGARMPLTEFTSMISSNTDKLAAFGGTATQGAQQIVALNRALGSNRNDLLNMGLNYQEINEALIDYQYLQRAGNRGLRLSQAQEIAQAEAAADYTKNLVKLGKLTGEDVKSQQAKITQAQMDVAMQARLATMSTEERKKMDLLMADTLASGGQAAVDALKREFLGMPPLTEEAALYTSQFGENINSIARRLESVYDANVTAADMAASSTDYMMDMIMGNANAFARLEPGLTAAAAGLDGPMATLADQLMQAGIQFTDFIDPDTKEVDQVRLRAAIDAAKTEVDVRDAATESVAAFMETLKTVQDAFQTKIVSPLMDAVAPAFDAIVSALQPAIDENGDPIGDSGFLGAITKISDYINNQLAPGILNFINAFKEDPKEAFIGLYEKLSENLFGEDGALSGAFASVTPQLTTMFTDILGGAFGAIGEGISNWFFDNWDTLLVGALAGIGILIAAPFIGAFAVAAAPFLAVFAGVAGTLTAIGAAFVGIAAMFGYEAIIQKLSDAWDSITGVFSGIGEWWSNLSFTDMISNAWDTVTGFFSIDSDFSISGLISDAWVTVTGFFSFGDGETSFSISQLATDAWATVTGFFSFGDGEGFSISQLATDAWTNVISWFGFGDGEGFSISQLATDAWATVTGFFNFGDFTFPSITSLFDGLWGKLTGFFDFDFKLPNFREFLPTWLGGSGKSLSDDENTIDPAAIENASSAGDALNQTQTALSTFAALPDLQNNLDILNRGLDINKVRSYNEVMEQLVETLENLNEVLAEDNTNMFGGGTGVAAADVLGQMNTASTGSSEGIDRLNRTMSQVLAVMQAMAEDSDNIERNTRSMGGNIANGRISAIRG